MTRFAVILAAAFMLAGCVAYGPGFGYGGPHDHGGRGGGYGGGGYGRR